MALMVEDGYKRGAVQQLQHSSRPLWGKIKDLTGRSEQQLNGTIIEWIVMCPV